MAKVEFPDLPPVLASLVRSGAYAIYRVNETQPRHVLVTSDGSVHRLSATGGLLEPEVGRQLGELSVSPVALRSESPPPPAVSINNA